MGDRHAGLDCRLRARERRVRVAVDERPVGLFALERRLDTGPHRVRVGRVQVEPVRRLRQPELREEHRRERCVPVLARVEHDLVDPRLAQRDGHGPRLDELRPVPDHGQRFHPATDRRRLDQARDRPRQIAVGGDEDVRLQLRQCHEFGVVRRRPPKAIRDPPRLLLERLVAEEPNLQGVDPPYPLEPLGSRDLTAAGRLVERRKRLRTDECRRDELVFGRDLDLAGRDPEQRLAVDDEPRHAPDATTRWAVEGSNLRPWD